MTYVIQYFILALPTIIFSFGLCGIILWRKNFILILIALEICFMASNLGFTLWSLYIDDVFGLIFCMTGLVLTGAEIALGLALAIILHKKKNTIGTKKMKKLRT